jgi:hypothetical protein
VPIGQRARKRKGAWIAVGGWLLAYGVARTSQVKVCRKSAVASQKAKGKRPTRGQTINSGAWKGRPQCFTNALGGIGRVPQVASSWFYISSHLFGFPAPEDETLLNFPNLAHGQVSLVGESVPAANNRRPVVVLGPPPVDSQTAEIADDIAAITDTAVGEWAYRQLAAARPAGDETR